MPSAIWNCRRKIIFRRLIHRITIVANKALQMDFIRCLRAVLVATACFLKASLAALLIASAVASPVMD